VSEQQRACLGILTVAFAVAAAGWTVGSAVSLSSTRSRPMNPWPGSALRSGSTTFTSLEVPLMLRRLGGQKEADQHHRGRASTVTNVFRSARPFGRTDAKM